MGVQRWRVATRGTAIVLGAAMLARCTWLLAGPEAVTFVGRFFGGTDVALEEVRFVDLLTGLCAVALLGCVAWLLAATCLVTAETILSTGRRQVSGPRWLDRRMCGLGRRICPRTLRRTLVAGCGAVLVTGLTTGTAGASAVGSRAELPAVPGRIGAAPVPGGPVAGSPVAGLGVPDRPTGSRIVASATVQPPTVVVAPGDSLWSLARRALAADRTPPTDAEVAAAWPALYRANLDRVGTDPDLIFPGTALEIPDLDRSVRKESS